jgi:hypothetical protein
MRSKPRRRLAASVILVVSLSVSQLELTALARNPDDGVRTAPESAPASGALKVPTVVPPLRPPASTTAAWPKQAAAPQDQTPKKKHGVLKWILIGAGAGAAAGIIASRRSQNPTPVITVGAPVVGQPQ